MRPDIMLKNELLAFQASTKVIEKAYGLIKKEQKFMYIDTEPLRKLVLEKRTIEICKMTDIKRLDVVEDIQWWEIKDLIPYIKSYFKYQDSISPTTLKHLRAIVKDRLSISSSRMDPTWEAWKRLREEIKGQQ